MRASNASTQPHFHSRMFPALFVCSKIGMTVLDPFAGVGSTLKACAIEERNGIGIELYPDFVELARLRLETEIDRTAVHGVTQTIIEGDARLVGEKLEAGSVDLIVTSPPYWGILNKKPDHKVKQGRIGKQLVVNYGNDPRDLGNIGDYQSFIDELGETLELCGHALRRRRYLILVVGDFRHGSRYHLLHADIAREMENRGYVLQVCNVLYQRHKRVFPCGYPSAYVANVHHQNIVILRKG
jgi:DNA modification methylase